MSTDIDELKALVASMAKEAVARDKKAEERVAKAEERAAEMQAAAADRERKAEERIAELVTALSGTGPRPFPVQPSGMGVQPNAAAVRQEKLGKLSLVLRKSTKVKDFTEAQEYKVKD